MKFDELEKMFDKENSLYGKFEKWFWGFLKSAIPRMVSFSIMIALFFYIEHKYGIERAVVGYLIIMLLVMFDLNKKMGVLVADRKTC